MLQQSSLFRNEASTISKPSDLRILTLNIQNPSIERAKTQFDWLLNTNCNILILTEAKYSKGCTRLVELLDEHGYYTFYPSNSDGDYISIIATKGLLGTTFDLQIRFLPQRVQAIEIETATERLCLVGMYVPTNDRNDETNAKKVQFQDQIIKTISALYEKDESIKLIICGDLNVLEPGHIPSYGHLVRWEYFYQSLLQHQMEDAFRVLHPKEVVHSWYSPQGNGQRLDHFLISKSVKRYLVECAYNHEPRELGISDHSAMLLRLIMNR